MAVGETDYSSFAILYLERARRLSVKLYGGSRLCAPLAPARGAGRAPAHTEAHPSLPPRGVLTLS